MSYYGKTVLLHAYNTIGCETRSHYLSQKNKNTTKFSILEKLFKKQFSSLIIFFISIENHEVASRILGFSVYASNTSRIVDGKLCYHENNNTIESMPSQTIVNCIVQARYIIYYNSRLSPPLRSADYSKFAYIDLCEVEVYGRYLHGFIGMKHNA